MIINLAGVYPVQLDVSPGPSGSQIRGNWQCWTFQISDSVLDHLLHIWSQGFWGCPSQGLQPSRANLKNWCQILIAPFDGSENWIKNWQKWPKWVHFCAHGLDRNQFWSKSQAGPWGFIFRGPIGPITRALEVSKNDATAVKMFQGQSDLAGPAVEPVVMGGY